MRYCLLVGTLLTGACLAAHATPSVAQLTAPDIASIKAERDALTRSYVLCVAKSAKRLDDKNLILER
jgi:hypothetical protein